MKLIDAKNLDYRTLNEELRQTDEDCTIDRCCGQRFIAAGMSDKTLVINGIPGNALGAWCFHLTETHFKSNHDTCS